MYSRVAEALSKSLVEHTKQNAHNKLSVDYLLANDARICINFIETIKEIGQRPLVRENRGLGLVVGNSYIHSLLPEFKLGGALICDINNDVLEYSHYLTSCILQSDRYDTFEAQKQYILDKVLSEKGNPFYSHRFREEFEREVKALRDLHFLASQERLKLCREFLGKVQLVSLNIDFSDPIQAGKIGDILREHSCDIGFFNMTNLRNYVSDLSQCLEALPIAQETVFLWSFIPSVPSASLSGSRVVRSHLSGTIKEYERTYHSSREAYFFPTKFGLCWYETSSKTEAPESTTQLP